MRSQLDKAARRALLDKIAAQRKNATRHELEDSDSDDGSDGPAFPAARATKPAGVVLESSDEGSGGEERRQAAPRRTAAPGAHRRLLKAAEVPLPGAQPSPQPASQYDGGDEDIAAALEQLTIRKPPKPGGGRSVGAASTAAGSRRPAAGVGRSRSKSPPQEEEAAEPVDDSKCLVLGDKQEFRLNARSAARLYPHQVEGVRWLWSLYRLRRGGILADDMGLGKTLQCAAFLAGLIESRLIRRAIVVAPKTLLAQWTKELKICGLGGATYEYGGSAGEREHSLDRVLFRRGVLLTTYGMVLHNSEVLGEHPSHDPDDGPMWDVMICDEGHKLKNPRMQLRKALDALPCALRVIISGTPIQNNLMEMWALFNFVAPDVLGEPAEFRDHFEKAITYGSDKHATQYERERGAVAAARLRQETGPYMLRREKKEVFQSQDDAAAETAAGAGSAATSPQSSDGAAAQAATGRGASKPAAMPHKNDLIVWLKLKPMQQKVYQAFLNSDSVKKVFNQTASALAAITVLKKVCDHPALLSERAAHGIVSGVNRARRQAAARQAGGSSDVEVIEDSSEGEELEDSEEGEWESDSEDYSSDEERQRQRARNAQRKAKAARAAAAAAKAADAPAAGLTEWDAWASPELEQQLLDEVHTTGFEASCKTVFVMGLLKQLVAEGHRTLVFSQSRVMLNILEAAIKEERWRYCRIDGSVASAAEREARVRQFQTSSSIPLFLLTSQVGGLGLTLTAADRVIILDPAWNPSTDNQSVDRAYRIGQTRDVVVYRLISCGTVEEKIYRRQVFKGGLSRTGMEEGEQFRYFAQEELRDLFKLEPSECESSKTQRELHAMHAHQRRETPELREHLEFLKKLECYAGVSDHDLLFSKKEREAPPQQPGSFTKPAAASRSSGSAAAGSSRPAGAGASPRKGVFAKTATQGWSGSSELSDLFAKRLSIGGGAGGSAAAAAAAQPPGPGWGSQGGAAAAAAPAAPQPRLSGGAPSRDRLLEHIEELEEALERKRHLLTLSAGLADGGARVRLQIAELEAEEAAAKRQAAGGSSSNAVTPTSTAGAAAPSAGTAAGLAAPAPKPPLGGSASAAGAAGRGGAAGPSSGAQLAAAAAPLLPSTNGAASRGADAGRAQPAAPGPLVAGAGVPPAQLAPASQPAVAAAPAPPPAKPAPSPLLTRMRDLIFGSGKKAAQPASSSAAAGAHAVAGGGRALSFGGQPEPPSGSAGSVIDLSGGDAPSASFTTATSQQTAAGPLRSEAAAQPRQALAPLADNSGGGGSTAGQPAKAPLLLREVKHRLMETLQAIKAAESGGYFDRAHVEKLRRRATKLNQRYEEVKAEAAAAAAAAVAAGQVLL